MPYKVELNPRRGTYGSRTTVTANLDLSTHKNYEVYFDFAVSSVLVNDSFLFTTDNPDTAADYDAIVVHADGSIEVQRYINPGPTPDHVSTLPAATIVKGEFYQVKATFLLGSIQIEVNEVSSTATSTTDKNLDIGGDLHIGGGDLDVVVHHFRVRQVMDNDISTFLTGMPNHITWDPNLAQQTVDIRSGSTLNWPMNIGPKLSITTFAGRDSLFYPSTDFPDQNAIYGGLPDSLYTPELGTVLVDKDWNLLIMFSTRVVHDIDISETTDVYKLCSMRGTNDNLVVYLETDGATPQDIKLTGKSGLAAETYSTGTTEIISFNRNILKLSKVGNDVSTELNGITLDTISFTAFPPTINGIFIGGDSESSEKSETFLLYGAAFEHTA